MDASAAGRELRAGIGIEYSGGAGLDRSDDMLGREGRCGAEVALEDLIGEIDWARRTLRPLTEGRDGMAGACASAELVWSGLELSAGENPP